MCADASGFDVIGIGSLNIDYVMPSPEVRKLNQRELAELMARFQPGAEVWADEALIDDTLQLLRTRVHWASYGGSAFNVIRALSAINIGLRLGFVGIAGTTQDPTLDFGKWFGEHSVQSLL